VAFAFFSGEPLVKRDTDDISITRRDERKRYELEVNGNLAAFAEFRPGRGSLDFVHTEVLPAYEGRGLGSRLARHALDDTRGRGLKVVATCAFIARYIEGHPPYQDLVVRQNPG
jgi:predicted GNAT family acetyltransferase